MQRLDQLQRNSSTSRLLLPESTRIALTRVALTRGLADLRLLEEIEDLKCCCFVGGVGCRSQNAETTGAASYWRDSSRAGNRSGRVRVNPVAGLGNPVGRDSGHVQDVCAGELF